MFCKEEWMFCLCPLAPGLACNLCRFATQDDFSGQESFVWDHLTHRDVGFFPRSKALDLTSIQASVAPEQSEAQPTNSSEEPNMLKSASFRIRPLTIAAKGVCFGSAFWWGFNTSSGMVSFCVCCVCCVLWCAIVCYCVLLCAVVCYAVVLCCAVSCHAVLCCVVLCCVVLCCVVLCCVVLCCVVLCCVVVWCGVVWCAVVWCGVLCCIGLCTIV